MSGTVSRFIDIVGVALFVGLILRYGDSAAKLITTGGHTFVDVFGVVSLQAPASAPRTSVGPTNVTAYS